MSSHEAIQRSLRSKFKLILSESKILIQTINGYVKQAERIFEATESTTDLTPKQFTRAMSKLETAYSACVKLILMANELFEHGDKSETLSPKPTDESSSTESETTSPEPVTGSRTLVAKETEARLKALEQAFHEYVAVRERMEARGGQGSSSGRVKEFRPSMKPALVVNRPENDGNLDQVIELQRFLHGLDKGKLTSERGEEGYVNEIACPVAPKPKMEDTKPQAREDLMASLKSLETSVLNLDQGHVERETCLVFLSKIKQLIESDLLTKAKCETNSSPTNLFIGFISPPPGTVKEAKGESRKGLPVCKAHTEEERSIKPERGTCQHSSQCKKLGEHTGDNKTKQGAACHHHHNQQNQQHHSNHFHHNDQSHWDQKQHSPQHHHPSCAIETSESAYLCPCQESPGQTSCEQHQPQQQKHLQHEMCSPNSDQQQGVHRYPICCHHHDQQPHASPTTRIDTSSQNVYPHQADKDTEQALDHQMVLGQILQLVRSQLVPTIQSHAIGALSPQLLHRAGSAPISAAFIANNPNGKVAKCQTSSGCENHHHLPVVSSPPYVIEDYQSNAQCEVRREHPACHSASRNCLSQISAQTMLKQQYIQQEELNHQQFSQNFDQPQLVGHISNNQHCQRDYFNATSAQPDGRKKQEAQNSTPTWNNDIPKFQVIGIQANDVQKKYETSSKLVLGSTAVEVRNYQRMQQVGQQGSHGSPQQQQQNQQQPERKQNPHQPCHHGNSLNHQHQVVQEFPPNSIDLRSGCVHPDIRGQELRAETNEDDKPASDVDSDCSPHEDNPKCISPFQNEARQHLSMNTARQVVPPTLVQPQTINVPESQTTAQERSTTPAQRHPKSINSNCCVGTKMPLTYRHQGKPTSSKGSKPSTCQSAELSPYEQSQDEDTQHQSQESTHNIQEQRKPQAVQDDETVNGDGVRTICITNLPTSLEEIRILELLRQYGRVSKIYFIKHRNTGLFRGIAYVKFSTQSEAESAVLALDKTEVDGQVISVQLHHAKV